MSRFKLTDPSKDPYIDGLLYPLHWQGGTLTYGFPTKKTDYGDPKEHAMEYDEDGNPKVTLDSVNFSPFDAALQEATENALAQFAAVANIRFERVDGNDVAGADLKFGRTDFISGGSASLPGSDNAGVVWLNDDESSPANAELQPGSWLHATIIHELGHILGLVHPHIEDDDEDGHDDTSLDHFPADRMSHEYSIMSYASFVGHDFSARGFTNEAGSFAQTLMMDDIAAIQHIHGANFDHNSGDTVYSFDATTGEMMIDGVGQGIPFTGKIFSTVWDGGGIDTYDFSDQVTTGMTIDLRPGQWSTVAPNRLAILDGRSTDFVYAVGNIANAHLFRGDERSLIENAVGGKWDDTIFGNQADNRLDGGNGDDALFGFAGNDVLIGGDGADWLNGAEHDDLLFGGKQDDELIGGSGDDILWGGEHDDELFGGTNNDQLYGETGHDELNGGKGDDVLVGGQGVDILEGGDGNDILFGGDQLDVLQGGNHDDQLYGDAGGDTLEGGDGDDMLFGGLGGDALFGGQHNDILRGGDGDDYLNGEANDDQLFGDRHNDYLYGGAGNDELDGGSGDDELHGGEDHDTLIDLSGDNMLFGEAGHDSLTAGWGNDVLDGGAGEDRLKGGFGSDVLIGGFGNDLLWGGGNLYGPTSDTFVFADGWGFDTIFDFDLGVDRLDFSEASAVGSMGDLSIHSYGNNALVIQGGNVIVLRDTNADLLNEDSMLF